MVSFYSSAASDVPKCKPGDSKCIQESTSLILTKYAAGLAGINLLSLDPIAVDKIDIVNGNQGPVNLKLFFNNVKLYGAKDAIVKQMRYVFSACSVEFCVFN